MILYNYYGGGREIYFTAMVYVVEVLVCGRVVGVRCVCMVCV